MTSGPRKLRIASAFVLSAALAMLQLYVPLSQAAQAAGPYSGSANVDLVHLQALNAPGTFQLADIGVAPSLAEANSAGLTGGAKSHATATNVHANLLSGAIDTSLLVTADQKAPPQAAKADAHELLNLPLDPLLNASVAKATAKANWNTNGCVAPGTPIADAFSHVADANVITAGDPIGAALAAVDNKQGATVFTHSTVDLVDVPGQTGKGVRATALTQLTGITLFKGTSNQLTVNVLAPPVVTAVATGRAGTAKVTYSEPILQVVDNTGSVVGELNAASANFTLDLSPLAILRLGTLDSKIGADGTSASGRAVLLEVELIKAAGALDPGARITIAGGEVSAKAPRGGVDCSGGGITTANTGNNGGGTSTQACGTGNPLRELQIGPSTLQTVAGANFTYTIAVSNRGTCPLDHVKVVDTVDGPPGSSITDTAPSADTVNGLTATWNDIGPLAPGQVKVLVVTVHVPSDATAGSAYTGTVNANATGGGGVFNETATVHGPTVHAAGSAACNLVGSRAGSSHKNVKPGETFNVYVNLLNSGGAACPNVHVHLPIDDSLQFVSCTNGCTNTGRNIDWTIPSIGPGQSLTLTATLRVPANATSGTQYVHRVGITTGTQSLTRRALGPVVSASSVLAPFLAAVWPGASVLGLSLPRTGAQIALMVAAAMALIAAGTALRKFAHGR